MTKAAAVKRQAKRGRPSTFTDKIADDICSRLSKGIPLAIICRDDDMPGVQTVADWQKAHPAFSVSIARARETGFDTMAAECIEIAEDGSHDYKTVTQKDGSEVEAFDREHVQRSKLRIETRLKLLSKWDPKRYGDKLTLDHGGAIGITITSDDADL